MSFKETTGKSKVFGIEALEIEVLEKDASGSKEAVSKACWSETSGNEALGSVVPGM